MTFSISFTGPLTGMSDEQKDVLRSLLTTLPVNTLITGVADGADTEADAIAHYCGVQTEGHPATGHKTKANPNHMFPADEPLARDRTIVKRGHMLIATPKQYKEIRRSGVWATVRYARKYYRPVLFIWPDGTVSGERNNYDE